MTFIWILWTLSSPLTQSDKYRKWKHTSFWFIFGFRNIIKLKLRSSAFQYLLRIKLTHSKMSGLTYKKFQLQEYLISPIFNSESRNLLFRLRTRTVSGVKNDFRGLYPYTTCPLGCGETDTIPNILTCMPLLSKHKSSQMSRSNICYEDIFSEHLQKQKKSPNYINSCCRLEMKLWANQCHLLVPCIVVIQVLH